MRGLCLVLVGLLEERLVRGDVSNERNREDAYPQKVSTMMVKKFVTAPATSMLGAPAMTIWAKVELKTKKIQTCRNMVIPRESTASVG